MLSRLASAVLFCVAVCGCGTAERPPASTRPFVRPPLQSIFEADAQLRVDPAATVELLRRLGVTRVKVPLVWAGVAPDPAAPTAPPFDASDPSAYPAAGWASDDAIIRAAATRGLGVDLTLWGPPPLWASGAGAPAGGGRHPQWMPSAAAFGQFVHAVAVRYDGHYRPPGSASPLPRVGFWAIWNEPNYGPYLAPQAIDNSTVEISPGLYRGLLDAAWRALQATGHGNDTVLIGELAPRGLTAPPNVFPGSFSGMVPIRFIRALYCLDKSMQPLRGAAALARGCPTDAPGSRAFPSAHPALFQAGGFSIHPYPGAQGSAPNTPDQDPDFPSYADLPNLPTLEATLDRAQKVYGSPRRLPVWSTEFGYQTGPPETNLRAVNPVTAAYYLNWAEYLSWRNPRIRSFDQYLLIDPPPNPKGDEFATALEFYGGQRKATFAAFRMPLYLPLSTARGGHALEVWGCVRPAYYAKLDTGAQQRAKLEFRAAGAASFSALRTIPITSRYGYFDVNVTFPASGTVRLAWSYPRGPTIYSRNVAIAIR